jgi:hypothetical protein
VGARITADNFYVIYTGEVTGYNLAWKAEERPPAWWPSQEYWNFSINPSDYIYVVAWDGLIQPTFDPSNPQFLLAQFNIDNLHYVETNKAAWQCYISGNPNPGYLGAGPEPYIFGYPPDITTLKRMFQAKKRLTYLLYNN